MPTDRDTKHLFDFEGAMALYEAQRCRGEARTLLHLAKETVDLPKKTALLEQATAWLTRYTTGLRSKRE
ncbi:hypothetical protein GJW-30_1_04183 [Variibacter gotjawalensis]|uniref:Uncharacterized protein n=1 Tax=Variibacter gotjawalensis TaxID=1333996 RepID=A0A0S3Q0D0_9BRAD|nr:hypothetical protein [Variibacter gotjawalensis]NIK47465.1 hypothetical protein [Variibacter gotjawalensis]RZS49360.1 hypothetical protein EV661_1790 [Variibacter gotjawalensis]BAT61624.1 hypothetical protein GJW-30_1_04183 [Variibacter gotjawalensis]